MTRLTVLLLAAPQPGDYDPSTGKGPEWGKAAPIGLLVILLLGVAVFFLLRSFTRQLKKVPASFDSEPDDAGPESPASVVPAGPAGEDPPQARPSERGPTERGPTGPAG
jgi:hypothetical protein